MNIETFKNLLDAHGADIQSWPDPEAAQEFYSACLRYAKNSR